MSHDAPAYGLWVLAILNAAIFVEDANGREYTYEVFDLLEVGPTDLFVTEPQEGKNILTLQTCTLPDYANRVIVQAELVDSKA